MQNIEPTSAAQPVELSNSMAIHANTTSEAKTIKVAQEEVKSNDTILQKEGDEKTAVPTPKAQTTTTIVITPEDMAVTAAAKQRSERRLHMIVGACFSAIAFILTTSASTNMIWFSFGEEKRFGKISYNPNTIRACLYPPADPNALISFRKLKCETANFTLCEFITKIESATGKSLTGNICSLEKNIKPITLAVMGFGLLAAITFIYCLVRRKVATKPIYYVTAVFQISSFIVTLITVIMCGMMVKIPFFKSDPSYESNLELGFFCQVAALILFLFAFFSILIQSQNAVVPKTKVDAVAGATELQPTSTQVEGQAV
ncbi:hypothetical protein HDU97_008264 [Phlyctochytrium planicorne]|nr:hypothetical protein HDU97_008264 [Phlyctochytrium planicorne]